MPLVPLSIPPGVYRNGTEYQAKGRYYDANLVRWIDGAIAPIGGWRARTASTVTGKARAAIAWKTNGQVTWLGIGTHQKLYVQNRAGTLFDITPAGFAAGNADATAAGGYGSGNYGTSSYGTPRPDSSLILDASVWSLDTWGENLVGVMADDGKIYQWTLNTGTPAAKITNSPNCRAIVVTAERILMALGSTTPRTVQWSDQEDNTAWTPSATNQAGSFDLQTVGRLMCGKLVTAGVLLFTDVDVHLARYTADTLVYSFDKVGSNCGVISQAAAVALDSQAIWMGRNGFWQFNGYVQPLDCDVRDYVFSDVNELQVSKTWAFHNAQFGEIEFHYCSSGSNNIDRCVVWSYRNNHWNIGRPARLCGVDRGVFAYPIQIDTNGATYEHEVGFDYSGDTPFAEGGPLELGTGDSVMHVTGLVPDEKTQGQVTTTFKTKFYPAAPESVFGPYAASGPPTNVRFCGRQVKVRYAGAVLADWRVGAPRLDVKAGGLR